jgi:hypothetical protein
MQEMFHTVTFVHSLKCLSISFQVLGPQLFVSLSVVLGFIDVNSHMSKLSGLAWSTCCTAVDGTVRPKGACAQTSESILTTLNQLKQTLVNISIFLLSLVV